MKRILLATAMMMTCAATAHAEELGDTGTVAVSGTFAATMGKTDLGPAPSVRQVVVEPSMDWFVANGVSLGVAPIFTTARIENESSDGTITNTSLSSYGAALRMGKLVRLGERASLWPRLAAHYSRISGSGDLTGLGARAMGVQLELPIVLELSKHTYLSFSFGNVGVRWLQQDTLSSWQAGAVFNGFVGVGFGGWF